MPHEIKLVNHCIFTTMFSSTVKIDALLLVKSAKEIAFNSNFLLKTHPFLKE